MGCGFSQPVDKMEAGATATVAISSPDAKGCKSPPQQHSATSVKTWLGVAGTLSFPEIDDPEFSIPALSTDKAPLAICISGGGFRAATLALGWLRGLQCIGVLQRARYLTACSGSSWVVSALCFQSAAEVGEFLGPYLAPEECSLEALKQVGEKGRSCAAVLADATPVYEIVRELLGSVFDGANEDGVKKARTWTAAITAAFLEPFGLGNTDSSTTTCFGTKGHVHESVAHRAAAVGRGTVYSTSVQQLPYPIICQAILLPQEQHKFYPFEWTPLYGGCPVSYDTTTPKLGASWVETLGLNCQLVERPAAAEKPQPSGNGKAPSASPLSSHTVMVRPTGPASLGEAIGISSAYVSYRAALGKSKGALDPHTALGYNTATYFNTQDWSCGSLALTDGGGVDYYAVYPALRRRVPNLLVLSASRTRIGGFDQFAKYMTDLAGLFGCWPGNPDDKNSLAPEVVNARRQVFPSEGFAQLHAALLARTQAGNPPVHVAEYPVLANTFLGIPGGWTVQVAWVVNDVQAAWETALPPDTRQRLESDRTGFTAKVVEAINPLDADTLRMFPHVSTYAMNYPRELVSLMANHAAHMVVAAREQLQGLCDPPLAAARGAAGA